ncbi:Fc.00g029620.m01.CDS01 [Cosmosporella sp. VM-42]
MSSDHLSSPRKLWEHPDPEATNMGRFRRALERRTGKNFDSFYDMHLYSTENLSLFWDFLWNYSGLIHQGTYTRVVDESSRMDSIPTWFEGIQLNFAENLLFSSGGKIGKEDDKVAITEVSEAEPELTSNLTWGELRQQTGRLVQAMKANGVVKGDRIAAVACNNLNTLLVFLATTALGGIFSSSSTDMGVNGVLERLRQIKPRFVFMDDNTVYNAKTIDLREKMGGIVQGMSSIKEFEGIISQPRFPTKPSNISQLPMARHLSDFLARADGDVLEFERLEFGDPFMIVYSSGTTGQPKCIVHSIGGVLLNAYKEGALHQEFGTESVGLQFTTTSWIMYIAVVQTLLFGARVLLYDGSPFLPQKMSLIQLAAQEQVTHLGVSPRYLEELQKAGIEPRERVDLSALQVLNSTGMVFPESLFEWFYDRGFPQHIRVNNMSGGTDIAGCFAISNAISPIYVGGCSGMSLGLAVEVYDSGMEGPKAQGAAVDAGTPGELVVTAAFPNMPVMFWGPNGAQRYQDAYFARFDDVWTHGDFVAIHPITKQLVFLGRSDGVLNPSGVRFGSAEIYKIVEGQFASEVADSVCVGQRRPSDTDERVFLFLLMKPGIKFTEELSLKIKVAIRKGLSARHVPAFVFPTTEIPTTINGKKVELPVKQMISGNKIKPSGTLANPESLEYYYRFARVEELLGPQSKL